MSVYETQFDPAVTNGATGGPMFKTTIAVVNSGNESREVEWTYPLFQYNVANGLKTQAQIDAIKNLFMNAKGKAYNFRFKDWADYTVVQSNSYLTLISGTTYQLGKNYAITGANLVRAIKKPVNGTVFIYKNAVDVTANTTINIATGQVTWNTSPPGGGDVLTWAGQFDVPVRFDTDIMDMSIDSFGNFSWAQIMMVEVRNPG